MAQKLRPQKAKLQKLKLQKVKDKKAYYFFTHSNDEVYIGDPKSVYFKPQFLLKRWSDECYIKLLMETAVTQLKFDEENNYITWESDWFTVKVYPINKRKITIKNGNREYIFLQNEYGGLEFEIILKRKPPTNIFSFRIQTKGLKFYYQPPLTEEFNKQECEVWSETYVKTKSGAEYFRPENVVGSYAVYHATKKPWHKSKEEAEKYKTGKAFHIYRPKAIDSDGNEVWCDLDIKNGFLTIVVPQEFLNKASYPINIDPTFGCDTVGGSSSVVSDNNHYNANQFTIPEDGTAVSISFYLAKDPNGQPDLWFIIYSDNNGYPDTKIDQSNELSSFSETTPQWVTLDMQTGATLNANSKYWLTYLSETNTNNNAAVQYYFDWSGGSFPYTFPISFGGGTRYYKVINHNSPANVFPTEGSSSTRLVSVYCTYSLPETGWLNGWQYRKSHEIEGSSVGAQTNYQVKIIIHYENGTDYNDNSKIPPEGHVYVNGKSRADFQDIRFTKDDGITELDYWFENKDTAETDGYGIFWVEVDSIPASPDTTTIYIYYGNPTATTTSNGKNTFVYWDDFSTDPNITYILGSPTSVNYATWNSNGWIDFSVKRVSSLDIFIATWSLGKTINPYNHAYHLVFEVTNVLNESIYGINAWFSLCNSSSRLFNLTRIWHDSNEKKYCANTHGTTYYEAQSINPATGVCQNQSALPRRFKQITREGGGSSVWELYDADTGSLIASGSGATVEANNSSDRLGISNQHGWSANNGSHIIGKLELVFIRKFVDPEPSHGSWGSEEAALTEVTVSDSATGIEIISRSREMLLAESAVGQEAISRPRREILFSEVAIGDEVISRPRREISIVELAIGTEAISRPKREMILSEPATGSEVISRPRREMVLSEIATGIEDISRSRREIVLSELAIGTEVVSRPRKEMILSEVAVGTEIISRPRREILFSEMGVGIEIISRPRREIVFSEVATGSENIFRPKREIPITELAIGTEIISRSREISIVELAMGQEIISRPRREMVLSELAIGGEVVSRPKREIPIIEMATGMEIISRSRREIIFTESATGIETIYRPRREISIVELASGQETVSRPRREMIIVESAVGQETLEKIRQLLVSDVGVGEDTIEKIRQILIADVGTGEELLQKLREIVIIEVATGTEEVGKTRCLLVTDFASGTEELSKTRYLLISDVGIGSEIIGKTRYLLMSDIGVGSEIIGKTRYLMVSDIGFAQESLLKARQLLVTDIAEGIENISKSPLIFISDSAIGTELVSRPFRNMMIIEGALGEEILTFEVPTPTVIVGFVPQKAIQKLLIKRYSRTILNVPLSLTVCKLRQIKKEDEISIISRREISKKSMLSRSIKILCDEEVFERIRVFARDEWQIKKGLTTEFSPEELIEREKQKRKKRAQKILELLDIFLRLSEED